MSFITYVDYVKIYNIANSLYSDTADTQIQYISIGIAIGVDGIALFFGSFINLRRKTINFIVSFLMITVMLFFGVTFILQNIHSGFLFVDNIESETEEADSFLTGIIPEEESDESEGEKQTEETLSEYSKNDEKSEKELLVLISQILSGGSVLATTIIGIGVSAARSGYLMLVDLEKTQDEYNRLKSIYDAMSQAVNSTNNEQLLEDKYDMARNTLEGEWRMMIEEVRSAVFAQAENHDVEEEVNLICSNIVNHGFEDVVVKERTLGLGGSVDEFKHKLFVNPHYVYQVEGEEDTIKQNPPKTSDEFDEYEDVFEDDLNEDVKDDLLENEGSVIPSDQSKYKNIVVGTVTGGGTTKIF